MWYNRAMATKITPEQQAVLQANSGQAVPMLDDRGNIVSYMVDVSSFVQLQGLSKEQDEQSLQKLKALIQDGIDSPGVPAEEAHERIRQMACDAAQKYA